MNSDGISITEKDYLRLNTLIKLSANQDLIEDLEIELERATIISDSEVPSTLITMNSKCTYLDLTDQKESVVTIVYPQDSNPSEGKVSILAPIGSALLGLSKDQEINWKFPNGKTKRLKVLEVEFQPEAVGLWHL